MTPDQLEEGRALVAQACRILAAEGLMDTILGHVSLRVDDSSMLIRCRGPVERGLLFSEPGDVRLVDFDGRGDDLADGYAVPNELPIHGELLRSRPELNAVVHAHPPAAVVCGISGIPLRPIFGSFNIPAMRMAVDGVPVYPRSVLIRRPDLAKEMMAAMGDHRYCLLKGHGITVVGATVQQAVIAAINLNALASVNLAVAQTGGEPSDVPDADISELPDLGSAFNDDAVWRFYVAKHG